jgi:hypothetical protein
MLLPHITIEEWKWLWIRIFILLLITSVPYLAGWITEDADHVFSGIIIDRTDYSVYLSAMHDGGQGELTYRLKFTTEPQTEGIYLRLFYHFAGFVGKLITLTPQTAFQAARMLFGGLVLVSIYLLCSASFPDPTKRQFSFLLISMGAGLGWVRIFMLKPENQLPVDFWMPEPFPLFSIFTFPHFSAVTACIAIMIVLFAGFSKKPSAVPLTLLIACGLFAQQVNPISPLIIGVSLFGISLCNWVNTRHIIWWEFFALGLTALFFLPQVIYQQFILHNNLLWSGFSSQNITLSPAPLEYFWGFGLFLILALPSIYSAIKDRQNNILFASAFWVLIAFIAAYFPVVFQRRFLHGVILPLGLLASHTVFIFIAPWIKCHAPVMLKQIERHTLLVFLSLFSLSTIILFLQLTLFTVRQADSIYDPISVVSAVDWLKTHADPDDAVLCSERTSQTVAERTGLTVYLGHWVETYDYSRKVAFVSSFYNGQLPTDWLKTARVQWVIAGPFEGVEHLSGLEPVYKADGVTIYSLKR